MSTNAERKIHYAVTIAAHTKDHDPDYLEYTTYIIRVPDVASAHILVRDVARDIAEQNYITQNVTSERIDIVNERRIEDTVAITAETHKRVVVRHISVDHNV